MTLASRQPPSGACTVAVAPGHCQTSITLFFQILVSQPCFPLRFSNFLSIPHFVTFSVSTLIITNLIHDDNYK